MLLSRGVTAGNLIDSIGCGRRVWKEEPEDPCKLPPFTAAYEILFMHMYMYAKSNFKYAWIFLYHSLLESCNQYRLASSLIASYCVAMRGEQISNTCS